VNKSVRNFVLILKYVYLSLTNNYENNAIKSSSHYLLSGERMMICIYNIISETRLSKPGGFFLSWSAQALNK
jgi:hypothetical protein